MKIKYKAIIGFAGTALFLVVVQMGMQFMNAYRWVGFESKSGNTWYSIAMTAQAYNSNCQIDLQSANEQIDILKKARSEANKDIE